MAKLSDLKKLVDAARASAPPPAIPTAKPETKSAPKPVSAKRAIAASRHADGDIDLEAAFADVQKLRQGSRVRHTPPRPSPIPKQTIADDEDALRTSKYGTEPTPETWEVGQEHEAGQTYVRRGIGTDVLKKLRRGEWSVQGEIDLHGHRIDEAHDALADFLDDARQHGYRCVRVIHGKGLTSPNREPVLKGKVRAWLAHWDEVLAYCEAPPHAGGGGAVMILLRGR
ncbi:MAG: Smr/MutS family protein [Betaproteobacteria bacterium]